MASTAAPGGHHEPSTSNRPPLAAAATPMPATDAASAQPGANSHSAGRVAATSITVSSAPVHGSTMRRAVPDIRLSITLAEISTPGVKRWRADKGVG